MSTPIYKDEYIEIYKRAKFFFIKSMKKGLTLEKFNDILSRQFPYINVTSFAAVKNALLFAPTAPVVFGEERARVVIDVTDDATKAYMTLYVPREDLAPENRPAMVKEINDSISKAGIVHGINNDIFSMELKPGVKYLIAEGTPPVNGEDSKIKLYAISAPKPQVIESGNVNHYELNLINHVQVGDWLGERIEATPGKPGMDVYGREIPAAPGRTFALLYDKASVYEEHKNGVTILRSRKNGAVCYRGDAIGVYDFLEIKGDVDFSTGNIDFDGFLSIRGSVKDSFSVSATGDLEILGDYGVGAADNIISRKGNIYIKGGIAGMGRAVVRCKKNLYVKFLSDVTVECEGIVYVGFYCINSNIRAKQVIVESPRGRIVGGSIDADISVAAAEIGNRSETRTWIRIRGFDRSMLKIRSDELAKRLYELKKELSALKQQINTSMDQLDAGQRLLIEKKKTEYSNITEEIKELEYELRNLLNYLKTPGEGAVIARTRIYPRVRLEIKGSSEEITSERAMVTYYYWENTLKTM